MTTEKPFDPLENFAAIAVQPLRSKGNGPILADARNFQSQISDFLSGM